MPGPGEYRPDPTEGINRIEDLPKPKIRCQSRNYRRGSARAGARAPTAIARRSAPSTIWVIPSPDGPATASCSTLSTTAPAAASISTPT